MKKEKKLPIFLLLLILIISCSSCDEDPFPPPKVEKCIRGTDFNFCPEEKPDDYTINYICISPNDYDRLDDWNDQVQQKLIECKSKENSE